MNGNLLVWQMSLAKTLKNNKMKKSALSIFFLAIILLTSCEDKDLSTIITTESRDLATFSKIHLDGIGDVEYIVDPTFKIEITTHIDLMHDIQTSIKNGELHIDMRSNNKKIKELSYRVYAPEIVEFKVKGVGNITSLDPIDVDHLTVLQDGVGSINLSDIMAGSIYARMSDVGDIQLSGRAEEVSYRMDGVGSIKGFGLEAVTGEARLEGVGDIEINVSNELTILHDGIGKVYYIGNPVLHISGDGGNIVGVD